MKILIDKEKCIGCGACEAIAPEIFKMKGDKAVVVKQAKSKAEENKAKESSDSCPTQAISIR